MQKEEDDVRETDQKLKLERIGSKEKRDKQNEERKREQDSGSVGSLMYPNESNESELKAHFQQEDQMSQTAGRVFLVMKDNYFFIREKDHRDSEIPTSESIYPFAFCGTFIRFILGRLIKKSFVPYDFVCLALEQHEK